MEGQNAHKYICRNKWARFYQKDELYIWHEVTFKVSKYQSQVNKLITNLRAPQYEEKDLVCMRCMRCSNWTKDNILYISAVNYLQTPLNDPLPATLVKSSSFLSAVL